MLRAAVLPLALLAAACTPAGEDASDNRPAEGATVPTPVPSAPRLSPITRADFESRLDPGAGCHIQVGDDLLLVAVAGDAVAKIDGALVDLVGAGADYDAVTTSSRFTAGDVAIEIAPDTAVGEGNAADGLSFKPVLVTVSRGATAAEPFSAAWVCGS